MKVFEIVDGHVYQSGRTNALEPDLRRAILDENDIDWVVNLWGSEDPGMRDLTGVTYIHYGIPDGMSLSHAKLSLLDSLAEGAVTHINRTGRAVLVQCYGGRNRSGLLSAMIARKLLGLTGEQALALVQERRRGALNNRFFQELLRSIP